MQLQLPEPKLFRQCCRHEDGWSDHYGALQVAATYAGVALPPRYVVHGVWQHGCFAPWEAVTPGALVFNAPGAQSRPVFVARREEADLLIAHGYPKTRAIGLPIVYAPDPDLPRMPRSLLVMPTHTLVGDQFPDRTAFARYADEVSEFAADFEQVTICIHPSCKRNGLWIQEFTERGFAIVLGAQTNDAHALLRMRALFAQFETVTTNGWGSHVAYALAFGAKVAIHGTRPAVHQANFLRDLAWSADVEALKLALSEETRRREQEFLREFLVPPCAAVANQDLGRWLIGAGNRLSAAEMAAVLAELVRPARVMTADLEARFATVRAQARAAAAAGRPQEAAQQLLQLVRAAVESRQPRLILETLTGVAADLAPIDPAKAAYLREQARKFSARAAAA